jgi:hypothetical protein
MTGQQTRRTDESVRILLFSMRNLTHHVARCLGYEFEDVIASCDMADMIAPQASPSHNGGRLDGYLHRIIKPRSPMIDGEISIDGQYEMFFAFCHNVRDLPYLSLIKRLRKHCRKLVCWIEELWPNEIKSVQPELSVIREFDFVFTNFESSKDQLERALGRPCYLIDGGIDTRRFFPIYPNGRSIDVYSMGRRPAIVHDALLARAVAGNFFYVYDTVSDFSVIDTKQHRQLVANFIKRSRYFITYPPKFDKTSETDGQQALGARFFEGAAGGAIMLGVAPHCKAFQRCFDWQDAVIVVPEETHISQQIDALDAQPDRLARARRENLTQSLLRHDWVYRWREIMQTTGMQCSHKMNERIQSLQQIACSIASGHQPATNATNNL